MRKIKDVELEEYWLPYRGLEINSLLFEKGIIVIKPCVFPPVNHPETNGISFSINSRELFFGSNNNKRETKKVMQLLTNLEEFCNTNQSMNKRRNTLIFNKKRREEIFASFSCVDDELQQFGFYLYPWLSVDYKNLNFSGFSKFVTAGRIFGTSIHGADKIGKVVGLIKHDREFHPGQKIISIEFDLEIFSAYESTFFSEFNKISYLIKNLSKKNELPQLHYHLPSYDYILFGIELFINGRITKSALNEFCKAINIRKLQYVDKLEEICQNQKIILKIETPFENLFGHLPSDLDDHAGFFLNKLGLADDEIDPESNKEINAQNVKNLVAHCLYLLKTNVNNMEYKQIWEDFLKIEEEINNFDIMYKLANAFMIAAACKSQKDYETCSMLPVSEKQIQIGYAAINKKLKFKYPAVFNVTILDPVITYDKSPQSGLLFYFSNSQDSLTDLIQEKKILDKAHANINNHATGQDPITLNTSLTKASLPVRTYYEY